MIFRKVLSFVRDIFIDLNDVKSISESSVQDLTLHYQSELGKSYLDQILVASDYQDTKHRIEQFKYESKREYVEELSELLLHIYRHYDRHMFDINELAIVPVPMHWSRYILRGYDHTDMLARRLAQMTGLPIKNILKTAYRPHQSRLNRISRLANKTNAFTIKNTISPLPKNIILLDDVISSGSTANACAEVLSRSGAQKIIGWFIASNH